MSEKKAKKSITLRFDEDFYNRFQVAAGEQRRSMQGQVEFLMQQWLDNLDGGLTQEQRMIIYSAVCAVVPVEDVEL